MNDDQEKRDLLDSAIRSERERLRSRTEQRPEQFWEAQRAGIRRRLSEDTRTRSLPRLLTAFALLLAAVAIGIALGPGAETDSVPPEARSVASGLAVEVDESPLYDPWESDELAPFHQALDWESWLDEEELEVDQS